jgi:hypothetical protein
MCSTGSMQGPTVSVSTVVQLVGYPSSVLTPMTAVADQTRTYGLISCPRFITITCTASVSRPYSSLGIGALCVAGNVTAVTASYGKFPEIFTGGNFPETFPTMFAHRFLLAYFFTVLSMFGDILPCYLCFGKVSSLNFHH